MTLLNSAIDAVEFEYTMDSLVALAYMLLGVVNSLLSLIQQLCMLNFPYAKAISITAFCLHGTQPRSITLNGYVHATSLFS